MIAVKLLAAVAGSLVALALGGLLVGWLVAILWNYLPFLAALHHMTWLDGFVLHILVGLLFKSGVTAKSSD